MARSRSAFALALALAAAAPTAAGGDPPRLLGFVALSGGALDAAPAALGGGFGKLLDGGRPEDVRAGGGVAEGRLAVDWEPAVGWRLFLHGVVRRDPSARESGAGSGLLEAFAERRFGFGSGREIVLRGGQFFLPSSRENVGPLWTSPYTLTLSALNSWVAEEIRPIGFDAAWSGASATGHRLELAGTVFTGNDTSGTLLAWRGFALHDRPAPTGRWNPLPAFPARSSQFASQSARGTLPFGSDLDGRPGWAGRARWEAPGGRALIQATLFRTEGDRGLHGDEYAWDTDFRWLSAEVEPAQGLRLIGEWGTGASAMGFAPPGGRSRAQVDISFETFYLLASWERGPFRLSFRWDDFRVLDEDSNPEDDNREDGQAWTLAAFLRLGERWRLGAEYLALDAERPAAVAAGAPPLDGGSFRLALRWARF